MHTLQDGAAPPPPPGAGVCPGNAVACCEPASASAPTATPQNAARLRILLTFIFTKETYTGGGGARPSSEKNEKTTNSCNLLDAEIAAEAAYTALPGLTAPGARLRTNIRQELRSF